MKKIGIVEEMVYNGLILVRAEYTPRKNTEVIDTRMKPVGHVVRVFGPVKKPYVLLLPAKKDANTMLNLLGREVYTKEVERNAETKKDRRK